MNSDKRFETLKVMIETENITEFKQLFDYIPKSVIGQQLRTNNPRINRLIRGVDDLTVREIIALSNAIDIEYSKVVNIVFRQYLNDNNDPKKRK